MSGSVAQARRFADLFLLTACILFSDTAASEAAFLVTGDKGLLALKRHGVTRIVTPAAMLEWLKTPDPPFTETP